MFNPFTLTSLAIGSTLASVGGSGLSFFGQDKAARANNKYQNKMFTQAAESAYQNYLATIAQTNKRLGQETAATGNEAARLLDEVSKASGTTLASAGSRGVRGNSVDSLIREYDGIQAGGVFDLNTNLSWLGEQAQESIRSAQSEAMSRIEQFRPNPVSRPSSLALGLDVFGSVAKGGLAIGEIRRKKIS